jgi:transcriptional regulator with XRE-family HTH domain
VAETKRRDDEQAVLAAWGDVIRRYRQWKQLSRRELAQRAGLSPVFVGELERGEKDGSVHSLSLIAWALDVPTAELYLRVAALLDNAFREDDSHEQTSIPLLAGQADGALDAVSVAKDETAFDLYKIARLLPADQQVAMMLLARSLVAAWSRPPAPVSQEERLQPVTEAGKISATRK